ncbi:MULTISPECIES: HAMP domain-containing sensor histidine kinase [Thalassotalea]|uniref:histidine kinase n=1 Tax=Thalassotalea castellviae TaxID=3075612 RepID=A0ABU3A7A2_9GAMM|nr:HAMP domain-containing sensor histidine kinase [Thalassotalea sp. W431]MDT0604978.1 HAMP domain-containing sensor histidine kinase [Thalassotalea sp. W431]
MSIGLITLLAIALFFGLARSLIKKVLNPLKELAEMAKSLDENKPELSFAVMEDKTEIGTVANTLHQTMARIHQYHQREKQFLQNASHELRTPIAVVASALDIIDLRTQNGTQQIADQITHIKRANENMKELTEALLLLSRKNEKDYPIELVDLNAIVTSMVKTHQYLIEDKFIEVSIINDENCSHQLPLTLCQIVLSNLIRNAFEHTLSGIVRIQIVDASVIISNSIESHVVIEEKQLERGITRGDGYGIGLSIVSKIVRRQHWQLHYAQTSDGCNQVTVTFK